jgi:hypothetical protein
MALITAARAVALVPQLAKLSTDQLAATLDVASNAIEAACGRKFAFAEVVDETLRMDVYGNAWLERSPVVSGTLSLKDLDNYPIGRWRLDTDCGELEVPTMANRILLATYDGGFTTIPFEIELAVANFARYRSERDASVSSGEIASKEIGSVKVTYQAGGTATASSVPKSIMDGIAHLVLPRLV